MSAVVPETQEFILSRFVQSNFVSSFILATHSVANAAVHILKVSDVLLFVVQDISRMEQVSNKNMFELLPIDFGCLEIPS